MGGIHSIAP
jgi:general transcription factor 3C polypeptide 1